MDVATSAEVEREVRPVITLSDEEIIRRQGRRMERLASALEDLLLYAERIGRGRFDESTPWVRAARKALSKDDEQ